MSAQLSFSVTLRAVDRAGNVGPASAPIVVGHGGDDGGCQIGRGGQAGAWWSFAFLAAGGIVLLRRRPR